MLFSEHLTKGLTKPKFCFFLFFFSHNYHKIFSVKRKYPVKPFPEGKKAPPVLFLLELVQFYLPWDTELIVREQSFLVQVREDQRELKKKKKRNTVGMQNVLEKWCKTHGPGAT